MHDDFDNNVFRELIPGYLKNELSTEQLNEFEAALSHDSKLRKEVQDATYLYVGMAIADKTAGDHIDSEHLAIYGTQPEEIEEHTRKEIEEHLKECSDCSTELKLCRLANIEPDNTPATSRGWFSRLLDLFMIRQVQFRPAIAFASFLLIAVATSYQIGLFQSISSEIPTFALSSQRHRGTDDGNVITIDPNQDVIELQLTLPTRTGSVYTFEIVDPQSITVLSFPNRPHQIPFALFIPSRYLADGKHTIRVVEEFVPDGTGRKPDTILVEVDVELID